MRATTFVGVGPQCGPAPLLEVSRLFGVSRAFTTAVSLDVFSVLESVVADSPDGVSGAALAQALQLDPSNGYRGAFDLFDLLVAVGVLQRTGVGVEARYCNTPAAQRHLVRGAAEYVGGLMLVNHTRSYPQFLHLEAALRGEAPASGGAVAVADIRDVFEGQHAGAAEAFALGMTGASLGPFKALAERFGFERFSSLGDIGGSAGVLSACVARAHPHMRCTTYDLPKLRPTAERYLREQRLGDRVTAADVDFFGDAAFATGHDVITMSMILHDWGMERKQELIAKAYAALPAGGAFVAIDTIIDDDRRTSVMGLYMSLNMLLEFGSEHSFDYTYQEFKGWVKAAGFRAMQLLYLDGPTSAAVAYK